MGNESSSMTKEEPEKFKSIVAHFLSTKSNPIWRANASNWIRKKAPKDLSIGELGHSIFDPWENFLELLTILLSDGQRKIKDIGELVDITGNIGLFFSSFTMDQFFVRLDLLALAPSLCNALDPYHLLNFAAQSVMTSPLCMKKALVLLGKLEGRLSESKVKDDIIQLTRKRPQLEPFLVELLLLFKHDISIGELVTLLDIFCSTYDRSARIRIVKFFNELPSFRREELVLNDNDINSPLDLECELLLGPREELLSKLHHLLDYIFHRSNCGEIDPILQDWDLLDGKKKTLFLDFVFDLLNKSDTTIASKSVKISILSSQKFKNFSKISILLPKFLEFCILNGPDGHDVLLGLIKLDDIKRNWDIMFELLQKYESLFIETGLLVSLYVESLKSYPASLSFLLSCDRELPLEVECPTMRQFISCIEQYPMLLGKSRVKQFLAEHVIEFVQEASSDLLRKILPLLELDQETILSWMISSIDLLELGKSQAIIEMFDQRNCLSALQEITEKVNAKLNSLPDPDEELYQTLIEAIEHDHCHVVGYSSCCSECYCD